MYVIKLKFVFIIRIKQKYVSNTILDVLTEQCLEETGLEDADHTFDGNTKRTILRG